jgi:hypothetical protein
MRLSIAYYQGFKMKKIVVSEWHFFLDDPIAPNGDLFPNQHIQIFLWDSSIIQNPMKYVPGLLSD